MLAAILLAGTCAFMPSFGDGPDCTPTNQSIECRCTECFVWDDGPADATHPAPDSYQVQRIAMDGTWRITCLHTQHDDSGAPFPPARVYCPWKHDAAMPFEGRVYRYIVAGCTQDCGLCSGFSPEIVVVTAPVATTFRPPVKGN